VLVKPSFQMQAPNPSTVCVGDLGNYSILPGAAYTWSISPAVTFSGQGSASISLAWNTLPGNYTITATPVDTSQFCNDQSSISIKVVEHPKPTAITGTVSICPGSSYLYQVTSAQSGSTFNWTVNNGTPATGSGTELNVTWGSSGPYWIAVSQTMGSAPYCTSDTIHLPIQPKLLLPLTSITGPNGCVNSVQDYSVGPVQHPDAVYSWVLSTPSMGSVISPQDSTGISIQWNNISGSVTISVSVSLCGNTLTQSTSVFIYPAVQPVITSSGVLCNGGVQLCVSNVTVVTWSGGLTPTSSCTTVSAAGQYTVTTTDVNGCEAIGITQVSNSAVPIAQISAPVVTICTSNSDPNETRSIFALHSPNSSYAWYCDNGTGPVLAIPQPSNPEIFIHTETGVDGSYAYYVSVTENTSGCSLNSNTVTIFEGSPCDTDSLGCDSLDVYSLSFVAADNYPLCNIVDMDVSYSSGVILQSWGFGDPLNNINNYGTLDPAQHTYTNAGYYAVTLFASVPRTTIPVTYCLEALDTIVCIPVGANFQFSSFCDSVSFNQQASVLTGFTVSSYSWDFGDSNSGTGPNPSHTYATGGNYLVILTVTTSNGCTAQVSKWVTVAGNPALTIAIAPIPPYCVGDPLQFNGGSGSTIISWLWAFGDGDMNGAQNPSHAYLADNTYNVILTGIDSDGCVGSTNVSVTISPSLVPGVITYGSPLTFCQGSSVILVAPTCSGCTYLWSNGATSPTLTVTTAGTFSVKVTDGNGCHYTTAEVTTNVLSLPSAIISGNPVICDLGNTTLSVPGGASAYSWTDGSSTLVGSSNSLLISAGSLNSPYTVNVTGTNGCVAISTISVTSSISPAFTVSIAPNACAGSPSTLTVNPIQVNVTYQWSNTVSGPSMTTSIAGTYYVTGTDTISGCMHTASGTINPQPELCTFPSGCYDICAPDTICGPLGLASYQWFKNNILLSETGPCLELNSPGSYTLTGTNSFGCSSTTDQLIVNVVPCGDCDAVGIDYKSVADEAGELDPCCLLLDYTNNSSAPLAAIQIRSVNGGLNFSSLSSAFLVNGSTGNSADLVANPNTGPLPTGTIASFIQVCIANPTASPQYIIIDWYNEDMDIVCTDSITMYCPIEPPCLYMASDSIYCDGLNQVYEVTLCNPQSSPFPVYYIDFQALSSATLNPSNITLTSPILPGACRTFTFSLSGAFVPGDTLCYRLYAHDADPNVIDTALCCSTLFEYCIVIPDCDPCDDVYVEQTDTQEGCCIDWSIVNNFQPGYFDGIDLCVLTPSSTLSINNTLTSGWQTASNTGTFISLNKKPLGSYLNIGTYMMPRLCMNSDAAPVQLVEVKWMRGDSIVCTDTLVFHCDPPCGYVEDEVTCLPTGQYQYGFNVTNTSGFTMDHATLVITQPTGTGIVQTYPLGPLSSGNTSSWFNLTLPSSIGSPGDTICYTMALHELGSDQFHINCCNIQVCFVLPDCGVDSTQCVCDEQFLGTTSQSFSHITTGNDVVFYSTSISSFDPACDIFDWTWGDGTASMNQGTGSISHTYPGPGVYTACVTIIRYTPTSTCEVTVCMDIVIQQGLEVCDVFNTPPVGLTKSIQPVPYPDGVIDRVQLKFYKALSAVKYSAADNAAIDIEFWPIYDIASNAPIVNGDTTHLNMLTKPGQEFYKWKLNFSRPDIDPNIRYNWRVRAHCQEGDLRTSPWSDIKIFTTPDFDPLTGIFNAPPVAMFADPIYAVYKADFESSWVKVYPNPSEGDQVRIELDGIADLGGVAHILIIDLTGKVLQTESLAVKGEKLDAVFDFSPRLSAGMYLISLEFNGVTYREKFMVK